MDLKGHVEVIKKLLLKPFEILQRIGKVPEHYRWANFIIFKDKECEFCKSQISKLKMNPLKLVGKCLYNNLKKVSNMGSLRIFLLLIQVLDWEIKKKWTLFILNLITHLKKCLMIFLRSKWPNMQEII